MDHTPDDAELLAAIDALCAERITPEQLEWLQERMKQDPAARELYFNYIDLHLGLRRVTTAEAVLGPAPEAHTASVARETLDAPARNLPATAATSWQAVSGLAAALLVAAGLIGLAYVGGPTNGPVVDVTPPAKNQPNTPVQPQPAPATPNDVRLASAAGARFFGELSPAIASPLQHRRDYVLTSGIVELAFPSGATAIIEAPAVFRIASAASLALDVGECSVHAPPGAEGFRVETQLASVVDRGTRFSIKVSENSETEVHVVEGQADIYPLAGRSEPASKPPVAQPVEVRGQEARRLTGAEQGVKQTAFAAEQYRRALPDRVVSYEATHTDVGAERLLAVSVQRGGKLRRYAAAEIIGIEPLWFRANGNGPDRNGHLAGGPQLPARRSDVITDQLLNTGLINPGGGATPLTSNPSADTPGMAVRFARAVINRPGPDVVLFEIQTVTNPPDGDAFHVSPLEFAAGLRSHTVRSFDIAMTSAEAQKCAEFHLYRADKPIGSLAELQTAEVVQTPPRRNFRVLATGIDLSQLGYADGAAVEGLFFEDARDNDHLLDAVFIGGLPE